MFAKVNGVKIYFDVEGAGYVPEGPTMVRKPPCFILHGGPGVDHTYYKPFLSPLAKYMQLIYIDNRGNGQSERTDPTTYTIEQMADDVEELRKYLGLGQVVVLGESFGGMIAQMYAVRYPKSVSHFIPAVTAPSISFWEEAQAIAEKVATPEQLKVMPVLFEGRLKNIEEMNEWWDIMLSLYFHQRDLEVIKDINSRMIHELEVVNYMMANEIPNFDVREQLRSLKMPTLVIAGRHDWVTPPSQAEEIKKSIPHAKLVIFENCGHFVHVEDNEAFIKTVLDFIFGEDR